MAATKVVLGEAVEADATVLAMAVMVVAVETAVCSIPGSCYTGRVAPY